MLSRLAGMRVVVYVHEAALAAAAAARRSAMNALARACLPSRFPDNQPPVLDGGDGDDARRSTAAGTFATETALPIEGVLDGEKMMFDLFNLIVLGIIVGRARRRGVRRGEPRLRDER